MHINSVISPPRENSRESCHHSPRSTPGYGTPSHTAQDWDICLHWWTHDGLSSALWPEHLAWHTHLTDKLLGLKTYFPTNINTTQLLRWPCIYSLHLHEEMCWASLWQLNAFIATPLAVYYIHGLSNDCLHHHRHQHSQLFGSSFVFHFNQDVHHLSMLKKKKGLYRWEKKSLNWKLQWID